MKYFWIVLTLLFLAPSALPAPANSCADQKAALMERARNHDVKVQAFNQDCARPLPQNSPAHYQCVQRRQEIEAEAAALQQQASDLAKRCN